MNRSGEKDSTARQLSPREEELVEWISRLVEAYPYQIVRYSKGALKLSSIYVLLNRLEEKGVVTSRRVWANEGGRTYPRRYYRLQDAQGGIKHVPTPRAQTVEAQEEAPALVPGWAGAD